MQMASIKTSVWCKQEHTHRLCTKAVLPAELEHQHWSACALPLRVQPVLKQLQDNKQGASKQDVAGVG
jgi:hypothetical protein